MTVSTIAFLGLGMMKPRTHRIFHYITASITMVAAIAYFSMAANLGWTPIAVEYQRSDHRVAGVYREIFYVRYIDWFITTPLLLMDLLLTAGMPWPTVLWVILVDWVMIVTGLVGALVKSSYKWGYFAFGMSTSSHPVYINVRLTQHKDALLWFISSSSLLGRLESTRTTLVPTLAEPSSHVVL
jgi:bacteriorhodopsin